VRTRVHRTLPKSVFEGQICLYLNLPGCKLDTRLHSSQMYENSPSLPAWHFVWPIPWLWEVGRAIIIPSELLGSYRPRPPTVRRIKHSMIYNPVLALIRALHKTGVSNTICLFVRILVEDWVLMLFPSTRIHRIGSDQLQLRQAIISVVATTGTENHKLLPCLGVCELLWPFVRR
jgi:hypothetical protein